MEKTLAAVYFPFPQIFSTGTSAGNSIFSFSNNIFKSNSLSHDRLGLSGKGFKENGEKTWVFCQSLTEFTNICEHTANKGCDLELYT